MKPKSIGVLTIKRQDFKLETFELKTARPFIFRQLTTTFLNECLNKNPSAKNIDGILEKEIRFLVLEHYEPYKRLGLDVRIKPLLRVKIRTTDSCTLETVEIEKKLKGLVESHG